jgi:hypothetical protein
MRCVRIANDHDRWLARILDRRAVREEFTRALALLVKRIADVVAVIHAAPDVGRHHSALCDIKDLCDERGETAGKTFRLHDHASDNAGERKRAEKAGCDQVRTAARRALGRPFDQPIGERCKNNRRRRQREHHGGRRHDAGPDIRESKQGPVPEIKRIGDYAEKRRHWIAEQDLAERRSRKRDYEGATGGRNQSAPPGERLRLTQEEKRAKNKREAEPRAEAGDCRRGVRRGFDQKHLAVRQQRAEREFPPSRPGHVECADGVVRSLEQTEGEGCDKNG